MTNKRVLSQNDTKEVADHMAFKRMQCKGQEFHELVVTSLMKHKAKNRGAGELITSVLKCVAFDTILQFENPKLWLLSPSCLLKVDLNPQLLLPKRHS